MASNKSFNSGDKAKDRGTLAGGLLVPNKGPVIVNGEVMPQDFIPSITSIAVTGDSGPVFTCTITVEGACPKGKTDNKLEFTDESGDTYVLRIYSETRAKHTVYYNSSAPNITNITWDI
ncbi:hypothetical protein F0344_25730 [Streptomyces finlayi]|uniref:Uncharacterized protein n=1 Tax=Streptomyces finlayi TaxID=67296 RepID=A0A7G7BQC9_9ACTN|nr:hypothetical protein [Streptomyces finlayi]QNE77544.1 hypothetical protein F0344_25730 [Streptomyces finlayi]